VGKALRIAYRAGLPAVEIVLGLCGYRMTDILGASAIRAGHWAVLG